MAEEENRIAVIKVRYFKWIHLIACALFEVKDNKFHAYNLFNSKTRKSYKASVGRNIASSWTQSGHLVGSTRKTRTKPETTPENTTFALLLSFFTGSRGLALLSSPWTQLLDIDRHELVGRMEDAARLGLINIRQSASILEVRFDSLLTKREMEIVYGGYWTADRELSYPPWNTRQIQARKHEGETGPVALYLYDDGSEPQTQGIVWKSDSQIL